MAKTFYAKEIFHSEFFNLYLSSASHYRPVSDIHIYYDLAELFIYKLHLSFHLLLKASITHISICTGTRCTHVL